MTPAPDASAFPPAPPVASTCPRCGIAATPAREVQTCSGCKTRFVLRYGALSDASVRVPDADPNAKELKLKAPGLIVVSQAVLKGDAVGFGALDPILGRFPIDEKGVRFAHLYSVAVWRAVNVAQAVTFFLLSLPIGLGGLALLFSVKQPGGLILGGPLLLIAGFHGWRVFGARAMRMRVVGFKDRVLDMTFVGSAGKRRRFVAAFFERAGLEPSEIP